VEIARDYLIPLIDGECLFAGLFEYQHNIKGRGRSTEVQLRASIARASNYRTYAQRAPCCKPFCRVADRRSWPSHLNLTYINTRFGLGLLV
jgi:hypothetical protein